MGIGHRLIRDLRTGKQPMVARSDKWPAVRARHLKEESACQACGISDHLEVHHIKPVHVAPELELVDANLITLCEKPGRDCHFVFGHFHDWSLWNPMVTEDVVNYRVEAKKNGA